MRQVAAGGTVLDPEVVAALVSGAGRASPLARLTPRESEVLTLMAEGRSNAAIAARMFVTEKAVGKHTNNIFAKLDLPPGARRQPPGARRPRLAARRVRLKREMTLTRQKLSDGSAFSLCRVSPS